MGYLRSLIRTFKPNRNYQTFETQKVKSSKFTVYRRKKKTSSIGKLLTSVSFFIAALCIFEAAVWFTTGFREPANNKLRILYLETRISLHQPTTIEQPFDITSQIIHQSALIALLLVNTKYIFDENKYLKQKYSEITKEGEINNKTRNTNQANSDYYFILKFLAILASPKKRDRWSQ